MIVGLRQKMDLGAGPAMDKLAVAEMSGLHEIKAGRHMGARARALWHRSYAAPKMPVIICHSVLLK